MNGILNLSIPENEPVLTYGPGTWERTALQAELKKMKGQPVEVGHWIGGRRFMDGQEATIRPPHEHSYHLGSFSIGGASVANQAIAAAQAASFEWANTTWRERARVFLKAAELVAGKYRMKINAATMLGQSKNAFQAEIDSACELADFLRFNVHFLDEIYRQQPIHSRGIHNQLDWRPLEGFVVAITPFNFTAIAGNLPTAPALCGNVVVWKPAITQMYSAEIIVQILEEAGLPAGVINLAQVDGPTLGDVVFSHRDFAGLHFTGSTGVFKHLWKVIGSQLDQYRSYPRIVGETGGKDFVMVHPSAQVDVVATALIRGAFEFQGQKCSAASRAYLPSNLSAQVKKRMLEMLSEIKVGSTEDFSNFVNAVIDEKSFDKIVGFIERAKVAGKSIIAGGTYSKEVGYFIQPTIIETDDPKSETMVEEIFGPVLTIYTYPEHQFEETLELVDGTSEYALTGAIISQDRAAVELALRKLRHSAGNFYINDKPTGAVVGQQPFGGARGSGTNDKAGAQLNLYRWLSCRTVKETFDPPTDYRYPFLNV